MLWVRTQAPPFSPLWWEVAPVFAKSVAMFVKKAIVLDVEGYTVSEGGEILQGYLGYWMVEADGKRVTSVDQKIVKFDVYYLASHPGMVTSGFDLGNPL